MNTTTPYTLTLHLPGAVTCFHVTPQRFASRIGEVLAEAGIHDIDPEPLAAAAVEAIEDGYEPSAVHPWRSPDGTLEVWEERPVRDGDVVRGLLYGACHDTRYRYGKAEGGDFDLGFERGVAYAVNALSYCIDLDELADR